MIQRLMKWLDSATCNFLAAKTITDELDKAGFQRLDPTQKWNLKASGKYYIVKNDSAVFAFIPGTGLPSKTGFHIISAHSDSPCFKVKPNADFYGDGGLVSLNVEKYGGAILYTWFDRPLSMSGRVMLAGVDPLHPETQLVDLKTPVCTIPHLAIHFNRGVNEGNPLSVQKDMRPVIGYYSAAEIDGFKMLGGVTKCLLAENLGVQPQDILEYEISLYPAEDSRLVGARQQFLQSARIDDLSMAFGALEALLQTCDTPTAATRCMAIFDNEETGSGTKQGAHSPVLRSLLERVVAAFEPGDQQSFHQAVAGSFMISADDAHAWHPNYNEKHDPTNHPVVGGGPVIKINANCKYMTDADGSAVFKQLCAKAGVKCQYFVNHSDVAGGSTLGNILTGQLDLRGVDMGNPIWAMHSAAETGAVSDQEDAVKVFAQFWQE